METNKKNQMSISLPCNLLDRINNYLQRPVSVAKSKSELFEIAVTDLLNKEELLAEKIEMEVLRIRRDHNG